jgi:hypothetical protein
MARIEGKLAKYLQDEFKRLAPNGWECHSEVAILSPDLEKFLGYEPRVDVLLQRTNSSQKFWIEFEISRADPVANHTKFATTHLFQAQTQSDTFVSMMSADIDRGKRNLGVTTIYLMRHIGMNAFQTALLPHHNSKQIKELNNRSIENLKQSSLDITQEIQRVFSISETVISENNQKIHFAGDILDVFMNLRKWNEEIVIPEKRSVWGKRTITYFVFDPLNRSFAPSKFCAYVAIPNTTALLELSLGNFCRSEMSINLYAKLDGTDNRFDGRRARLHLIQNLAMTQHEISEVPEIFRLFENWLFQHSDSINVHPKGIKILMPPEPFTKKIR